MIQSADALLAAFPGQHIHGMKTQGATTVAGQWHTLWDRAGKPGAGSLAVGNTAAGVIPDKNTVGAIPFTNAPGVLKNYLARLFFTTSVAGVFQIYDRLFHAGSFVTTALATTALSGQPVLTRNVGGEDAEIWLEINTAMGATATTVEVTYTNSAGVAGRTTGAQSINGFITGRMLPMPLQAGDTGVQKIESVIVGGVVGVGTFNVIIMRRIAEASAPFGASAMTLDAFDLGLPEIPNDACLAMSFMATSTSSGVPVFALDIVSG